MRSLLLPILAGTLLAGPALSQGAPPCMQHSVIAAAMSEKFGEAPVARMLTSRGLVIEILASAGGESFTVLMIAPDGNACVVSLGSAFELVAPVEKGRPS